MSHHSTPLSSRRNNSNNRIFDLPPQRTSSSFNSNTHRQETSLEMQKPGTSQRYTSSDEGLLDDGFAPGTLDGDTRSGRENSSVEQSTPVLDRLPSSVQNDPSLKENSIDNYGNVSYDIDSNNDICGRHEDFHTIDWLREMSRSRQRHRQIQRSRMSLRSQGIRAYLGPRWRDGFSALWDASSGWLCVIFIGLASGFFAGIINIVSESMSDVKQGICTKGGIFLNEEACCWSSIYAAKNCTNFQQWGTVIFGVNKDDTLNHIVTFIVYNLWGIIFAICAACMVKQFAPYACGSGIPEVKTILSGFVIHGFMGKWTLLIKSLSLPLVVGAGLCLGKEGPMVHIASCCGNFFAKRFPKYRNEAKRREILSAACAAGVSVAFGAPIGGVLFSLEEASYYFPLKTLWRSFMSAMIAAITLATFNPYGSGSLVMFQVDKSIPWKVYEVVPFIILGAMGGLYGALFIKLNIKWCKMRKSASFGHYPIEEIALLGFVTCALSYPFNYSRMSMTQLIRTLFATCNSPIAGDLDICAYDFTNATREGDNTDIATAPMTAPMVRSMFVLLYVALVKGMLTVFTFGSKIPCGLFIPTLCVGSIVGRLFGMLVEQLTFNYPHFYLWRSACSDVSICAVPGVYAMVGAAAFLGGVTRMTVSLVVIMFELTGSLQYIVPFMIAAMTSKWVGDAFKNGGIYDDHITLNGYPFLDNKDEFHDTAYAIDIMRPKKPESSGPLEVLRQDGMFVRELEYLAKRTNYYGFPVVVSDDSHRLVGFVTRRELMISLHNIRQRDIEVLGTTRVSFVKRSTGTHDVEKTVRLNEIIDLHPITVTIHTPVETVVEIFKKLGVRQVLTVHHGKLLGIITKKDVLRHIAKIEGNTSPILFN